KPIQYHPLHLIPYTPSTIIHILSFTTPQIKKPYPIIYLHPHNRPNPSINTLKKHSFTSYQNLIPTNPQQL
ncbi:hypothetical protein, partial [Bacillus pumilus]|uniref:hypothetical protein n=1 Tax=Bacillus pumilus TaxID=1408 RepID=UPI003F68A18E